MVKKVGFHPVGEAWPSCYAQPALRLLLVVHVVDFKLSGPAASMSQGWSLLRRRLQIEEAKPIGLYLGCHHEVTKTRTHDGHDITVMQYNMQDFLTSCVDRKSVV